MTDILEQAIEHHRTGQLAQAEQLYRTILQTEPSHPDANHNLGVLYFAVNNFEVALPFFKTALEINPNHLQFLLSYLDALLKTEQFELAKSVLEQGQERGLNSEKLGQLAVYLSEPTLIEMEKLLSLFNQKNYAQAESFSQNLIQRFPNHGFAWKALGAIFQEQEQFEKSLEAKKKSVELLPNDFEANYNLGNTLQSVDCLDEAEKHYRQALAINPNYAEAFYSLGCTLRKLGRLQEAEQSYRNAISVKPDYAQAYINLGDLLNSLDCLQEAEANYETAIRLQPNCADFHFNLAIFLLLLGQFERGWKEYLWLHHPDCTSISKPENPGLSKPQWQGESLEGKTVLICCDQGLGDMIQFARYSENLKNLGATVWVGVHDSLIELIKTVPWIDRVCATGDQIKRDEYDYWTFFMTLPSHFNTVLETIPATVPYITADETKSAWWKDWLAKQIPENHKRVGLVWAGNPLHLNDANRSLAFSELAAFSDLKNVIFVSLQLGEKAQNELATGLEGVTILDASPFIHDFTDSAALLNSLDLLLTIDSSPAHLAGALNLPVWLMLPKVPDWRWLLNRNDSPWYKSMRLFRQKEIGDWTSVLNDIKTELATQPESESVASVKNVEFSERIEQYKNDIGKLARRFFNSIS